MTFIAVLMSLVALQGTPFKATLTAAGHTPTVNARWAYSVGATSTAGKPIAARITVQTKDPLGGIHPIEFFNVKKNIVNYPFKGVFRDAITWPPASRGIPLTLRITVKAGGATRILSYAVTPK
jgi:hypothetical protein